MDGYESLGALTLKYWWWLAADLAAAVWFWIQIMRGRGWSQPAMKGLLVLNAVVIGALYFTGILPPAMLAGEEPAWLPPRFAAQLMAFLYLLLGLFWLLDAFLSRTVLTLPQRPRSRVQIILGGALGLLFPLVDLLGGHLLPRAQAFGDGPAALVLFSAVVLGGSRPDTWIGRLLLILTAALSLEAGLAAAVLGGHWHYLTVTVIAILALVYGLRRRRMVALNAGR